MVSLGYSSLCSNACIHRAFHTISRKLPYNAVKNVAIYRVVQAQCDEPEVDLLSTSALSDS